MKGYIALSRVKKVDDLYLPQAFSPALLRQGEQPWPTLLIQFLKGERDVGELEEEATNAERKCRKPKKLKDFPLPWACGKCAKTFDYNGFLVEDKNVEEEWYTAYWKKIIAPGDKRLCMQCTGEGGEETHECPLCNTAKPKAAFPDSMWPERSRQTQRCRCFDCCRPRCTAQPCTP